MGLRTLSHAHDRLPRVRIQRRRKDVLTDTVKALDHIAVAEAQHCIAGTLQPIVSPVVTRGLLRPTVMTPVDLDDKPFRGTAEIHDVRADRRLAPEAKAIDPRFPQAQPQAEFGIGHRPSHDFCHTTVGRWHLPVGHDPLPKFGAFMLAELRPALKGEVRQPRPRAMGHARQRPRAMGHARQTRGFG
jgi:hypothetical protein